mgnify:CR=1 FL=1|tara:strand:+ start:46 stop:564 length:519 start_codon:yes stop_codon:yes gene_type:complete
MATNLQFIKSVTPTGASSSISITDVFSASYNVYVVNYNWVTDSGSPKDLDLRFINSSDTIVTNSNYDYAYLQMYVASSFSEVKAENQDKITAMLSAVDYPPEGNAGTFTVYNPFATSYTFLTSQSSNSWNGTRASWKGIAVLKEETSITGFNMFISSTNPTSDSNISVYGVK